MSASLPAEHITTPPRLLTRFGPFVVVLALAIATASFLIFSDYTPLAPTDNVVLGLFIASNFLAPSEIELIIHGTTLATNAIIERIVCKGTQQSNTVLNGTPISGME